MRCKENKFAQDFAKVLRSQGALVYPMIGGLGAPRGWPDKLIWCHRWDGLVELKGEETQIEALQFSVLRNLHKTRPRSAVILRHRPSLGTLIGDVYVVEDKPIEELICNGPTLVTGAVPVAEFIHFMSDWRDSL